MGFKADGPKPLLSEIPLDPHPVIDPSFKIKWIVNIISQLGKHAEAVDKQFMPNRKPHPPEIGIRGHIEFREGIRLEADEFLRKLE
jgi:hypothetical protein